MSLAGPGLSDDLTYSLFQGSTKVGDFEENSITVRPETSGQVLYSIQLTPDAGTIYYELKDTVLMVHPNRLTWKTTPIDAAWDNEGNWISPAGGTVLAPIWCTDVTIPTGATQFPAVVSGDEARDVRFEPATSIGNVTELKYRYAFVDMNPPRNEWFMASAPLKYMYSADYSADYDNWSNAISPSIYMRYFDVAYTESGKTNPDNVAGTSTGNFSRSFANLEELLPSAFGFALYANGAPDFADNNFTATDNFEFPRRNADSTDVRYSYHTASGAWTGSPFYLSRGTAADFDTEWTSESTINFDNRFRFIYENATGSVGSGYTVTTTGGNAVMIGNPFMSYLDFEQFYNDNAGSVQNYFRRWDGTQFYSYTGVGETPTWEDLGGLTGTETTVNQYIAPMNAFFVETIGTGDVNLVFTPQAAAVDNTADALRADTDPVEYLQIGVKANDHSSYTVLAMNAQSSNNYLPGEDIYKLFSPLAEIPEIYTISDKNAVEINRINSESQEHLIPLGIKTTATGPMELSIRAIENITSYDEVILKDIQENISYNLKETDKIEFTKESSDNLEGRFYIQLRQDPTGIAEIDENSSLNAFYDQNKITVVSPQENIIGLTLYSSTGNMIQELNNLSANYYKWDLTGEDGIYILSVRTENGIKNFKFIK